MEAAVVERPRSSLTHSGANEVFELAAKAPVRIKGRNEPDEILLNAEQYESWRTFLLRLLLVTRAMAKGADQMPDLEGLRWSKLFSRDERAQMLGELMEAARASLERNDASIFNATWKGWAHSSEAMSDPAAMAKLTAMIDPAKTIRLQRP